MLITRWCGERLSLTGAHALRPAGKWQWKSDWFHWSMQEAEDKPACCYMQWLVVCMSVFSVRMHVKKTLLALMGALIFFK